MSMTYAQQVGQRLRAVREQRGMSLGQVQEASGGRFQAGTVGTWERASREIYADDLAAYAGWLGIGIRLLLPPEPGEPDRLAMACASIAIAGAQRDIADLFSSTPGHARALLAEALRTGT